MNATMLDDSWRENILPELRLLAAVVKQARRDAGELRRRNRQHYDQRLQRDAERFLTMFLGDTEGADVPSEWEQLRLGL